MSFNRIKNTGLVYSSEQGKMCPACSKPAKACTCKQQKTAPKTDGIVRVCRETKGRKGKGMTVITEEEMRHRRNGQGRRHRNPGRSPGPADR